MVHNCKKMAEMFITAAGLCLAAGAAHAAADPVLWYRADVGVETDAGGNVTRWRNQGSAGAALDVVPDTEKRHDKLSAPSGNITLGTSSSGTYEKGGKPVLNFPGTRWLITANQIDFNTDALFKSNDLSVVIAFKPSNTKENYYSQWLFSCPTLTTGRFGIQGGYTGTSAKRFILDNFRTEDIGAAAHADFLPAYNTFNVFAMRSEYTGEKANTFYYDRMGRGMYLGATNPLHKEGTTSHPNGTRSVGTDYFAIGVGLFSWGDQEVFQGEIGEIQVYNRKLSEDELYQLQLDLASRFGIHVVGMHDNFFRYNYVHDMVGSRRNFTADERVTVEPRGGFRMIDGYRLIDDSQPEGHAVVAGHNGQPHEWDSATGLLKRWWVSRCSGTRAANGEMTFEFTLPEGSDTKVVELVRAKVDETMSEKTMVRTAFVEAGNRVRFTMTADEHNNGSAWTLRALTGSAAMKPAFWYKADDGVTTDGNGVVTKWANLGSAEDADLFVQRDDGGAADLTLATDATHGYKAVNFPGDIYLATADNLPIGQLFADGKMTVLAAFKKSSDNQAGWLFGSDDATSRFGLMGSGNANNPGNLWTSFLLQSCNWGVQLTALTAKTFCLDTEQVLAIVHDVTATKKYAITKDYGCGTTYATGSNIDAASNFDNTLTGKFYLGRGMPSTSWTAAHNGNIAELRVYNVKLDDVAIHQIGLEMSAKYGCDANGRAASDGSAADITGARKRADGTVQLTTGNAGGMWIELESADAFTYAGEAVVVGHNGAAFAWSEQNEHRFARAWRVTSSATGTGGARLCFDFSGANAAMKKLDPERPMRLCYRANGSGAQTALETAGVWEGDTLVFTLDADAFAPGHYSLDVPRPPGMVIVVR